jgi:hypothetical protein
MMPIGRRLSVPERAQYRTSIPGLGEAKRAAIYDVFGWAAAATVLGDQNFFAVPLGGPVVFNGAAIAKTLLQTNLKTQGQLPAGQELEVWDIRVQADINLFNSDTTTTILSNALIAVRALLMGSFMVISIDGKDQLQISPVALLSAGYGPAASGYGGANVTAAGAAGAGALFLTNGSPNRSALWNLNPIPIVISPGLTFSVTITTPIGVVLPANTALNWWVHLDGVLHKKA